MKGQDRLTSGAAKRRNDSLGSVLGRERVLDGARKQVPDASRRETPRRRLEGDSEDLKLDVRAAEVDLVVERRQVHVELLGDGSESVGDVLLRLVDAGRELDSVVLSMQN